MRDDPTLVATSELTIPGAERAVVHRLVPGGRQVGPDRVLPVFAA